MTQEEMEALVKALDDDIIEEKCKDIYNRYSTQIDEMDKPKNNFKEFGFSGDFEGEILKELNNGFYVGYIISDSVEYVSSWNSNGLCIENSKYNLIPLKKEWYEVEDNIGKLCTTTDTKELFFFNGKVDNNCVHSTRNFKLGNRKDTN